MNIYFKGSKFYSLGIKCRKTRMSTLTTVIQHSTGSPSRSNQTNKRNKRHPNRKRRGKTVTVCIWLDTIYIENPKDSTPKLPELINKFSRVAGYKINIQKSVTFLYTSNEILEKEYKSMIPFKIAPHKIKYLGIHLTKEVPLPYMPRTIKL